MNIPTKFVTIGSAVSEKKSKAKWWQYLTWPLKKNILKNGKNYAIDFFLIIIQSKLMWHFIKCRGRSGRDRTVVGFTTTYVISAYQHWCCEFESRSGWSVQHYVIKFVSDLQQVYGFLRVLRFTPPIKLTATI